MSGEILNNDGDKREDAAIVMKAAQDLREYSMTRNKTKEAELIQLLSTRPTLIQRFFPTEGQKVSRELAAKRLHQIVEHEMQAIELHQSWCIQAAETIADVQLSKLKGEAAAEVARHFTVIKEGTLKVIQDSTYRTRIDMANRKKQAQIDFADDQEYLDDALSENKLIKDMCMKSTEELIKRLLASLDGLHKKS